MKRDMSLIRSILLFLEGQEEMIWSSSIIIPDYDGEQILYHIRLMQQAGLIEAEIMTAKEFNVRRITWAGHDLLDAIRKPRVWQKVLDKTASAGVSLTVDVAKELAVSIIKQSIGI